MRAIPLAFVLATTTLARAESIGPLVEHRLFSPSPQPTGLFGYSSAVQGKRMVIGALTEDGVTPESGAAYVYRRVGDQWQLQSRLVAPDGQSDDLFGTSASLDGDTLVIGAPSAATPDGIPAGAAYVFREVSGQWQLEARLIASDPTPFANFGFDQGVSISGDTIVVTTAGVETGEDVTTGGAAYVFTSRGTVWTQTARITDPDDADPAGFGNSVSIRGKTLVVGAAGADDGAGAAYVFRLHHDAWVKQARLTALGRAPGAGFGFSTAIDGDAIAIGGVNTTNDAGMATGATYVFERDDDRWIQRARLLAPGGRDGDGLGRRVVLGDGTLAAGSEGETNPAGVATGAAQLYRKGNGTWAA